MTAWLTALVAAVLGGLSAWVVKRHKEVPEPLPEPQNPPVQPPPPPIPAPHLVTGADRVYQAAKASLGKKMSLNTAVNPEEGCAEALSAVLALAGYKLPPKGIPTVNGIIQWMLSNGFKEMTGPSLGCVITAHRLDANDPAYAHCGVVLKFGIASNDSRPEHLGLFLENYSSAASWQSYFSLHNSQTRYFLPV